MIRRQSSHSYCNWYSYNNFFKTAMIKDMAVELKLGKKKKKKKSINNV